MTDSFRYGKDGKSIDINQFKAKLQGIEHKVDENAWKLFSLFDSDKNGTIDEKNSNNENEFQSLFNRLVKATNLNNNDILEDNEIEDILLDAMDADIAIDRKNIVNSLKSFFNSLNEEE